MEEKEEIASNEPVVGNTNIVYVPIDKINVPAERVTSQFDAEVQKELMESIKQKGVLTPIILIEVNGELWLVDGYNRIRACEELGIKEIPAIIKKGTYQDVVIENLITARQKGKSNPYDEAKTLAFLVNKLGMSLEEARKQMGISQTTAIRYMKVATLPDEIFNICRANNVPITGAVFLTLLNDPEKQREIANDAVHFGYTSEQIKARVYWELGNKEKSQEVGYQFTATGEVQPVYPKCHFCHKDIVKDAVYIWLHQECKALIEEFAKYYWAPREETKHEEGEMQ